MARSHTIRLINTSQQLIPLQLCPPQGDFYLDEQQVRIRPGTHIDLPKSHLRMEQIRNLQAKRMLRVLYDSEELEG